jgi:hypothetical protein
LDVTLVSEKAVVGKQPHQNDERAKIDDVIAPG